MDTENFYAELPSVESFLDATDLTNFVSVPQDWCIVITDIVGSTKAIESGRYKEVNLLGACSISAVLNAVGKIEVPYVFGGDGASFLLPPSLLDNVKPSLWATQYIAKTEFGMNLRVGFVPVATVTEAGYDVKITKLKVSENYSQAIFTGGGLNYAIDLIKAPETALFYQLQGIETSEVNLTGLECRWQDIPSRHGETVSLIVLAMAHDDVENNAIYREVIEEIHKSYGSDDDFHPIAVDNLKLSLTSKNLMPETKVRTQPNNWFNRWLYLSQIQIENILGLIFIAFRLKVGGVDWGLYKKIVQAASDYKKFDDTLRMIIDGTANQREELTNFLENKYCEGKLVYGLHVSACALMTCLVFERSGRQVHFVDGANGGYTLAAKPLKEKMKRKAASLAGLRENAGIT